MAWIRAVDPSESSMWQSMTLDQLLTSADDIGIRPVIRTSQAVESRQFLQRAKNGSIPPALDETALMERRHQPRRHSDSGSSRSQLKEIASAAACAALDRLDLAIILLHSDRHVLLSNPAARRIATRGDCFRIAANRLQLIDQQNQRVLQIFLSDRTATNTGRGRPLCVSSRDDGAHCYFLFAEWLNVPSPRGSPIASLLIYEPHLAGQLSHELLAHLYGLTRMEARLVAALFVAPVLQTAADRCGITMNTAKTHLKHAFAKCGVCSKAELLRLLALGPRTI
jgi:hypothetical protein